MSSPFVSAEVIFLFGSVVSQTMPCYLVFLLEEKVCLHSIHCNSML